ncbi:MAG: DUF5681 domain-containing protein [Treponema sp.]|jgi:hypothetical protein|nr:DUF5681 domain-containing protein [Treponema sp.]
MPFAKGQSGNPYGRPKKAKSLTNILEKALSKKRADGRTNKAALVDTLISLALAGDVTALKYVYDRVDGKLAESVNMAADVNANANLEVIQMSREDRMKQIVERVGTRGCVYRGTE